MAFDFQNGRFGNQVLKQILEEGSRHLYFVTLSLWEISLRSHLIHLGAIDVQNGRFGKQVLKINIGS